MAITNVGGGFNDKKALCFSLALPFCNAKSVSINSCSPTNEKKINDSGFLIPKTGISRNEME